jgi:hypothetical protein
MKASEWRREKASRRNGLSPLLQDQLIADLEVAGKAREKAEAKQCEECRELGDRAEQAEADLVTANLETAKWHQAFGVAEVERDEWEASYKEAMKRGDRIATEAHENCDRMMAERDALKAELTDYKEAWEARDMPCEEATDAAMHAKLNRIKAADARIRARREKEAGR